MEYILSALVIVTAFVALTLLPAANPKLSKALSYATLGIGVGGGLLIYGYGYIVLSKNFLLASLKAILAVCGAFLGNSEYESIAAAPLMQTQWMQIICAIVQLCALYATASAVISAIGTQAIKRFRLWLGRNGNLNLIYGINENTLKFGKELVTNKNGAVVFVSRQPNSSAVAAPMDSACILQSDASAISADNKFLRRLGFGKGKRKLTLYALDEDSNQNIQYATSLLNTLRGLDISPERTSLVLIGQEEIAVSRLQQTSEKYGYGFVTAINEPQMVARLLATKYPPCNVVPFNADGKASKNFEALLIGFGKVGQMIMKTIIMNGQFEGSNFRLDVFARNINSIDGNFNSQFGNLSEEYNVHFYDNDARSRGMYTYLDQHADTLRYIVIATGDEKSNNEIAEEMSSFLNSRGRRIPIYKCGRQSVATYNSNGTIESEQCIYSTDVLCSNELDEKAMIFNHRYQSETDKTALQTWMECDYFSRQSCRAAADFIPAVLRAVGKSAEQVIHGDWALSKMQIENLSRTEHLRWCAFHYCMGFTAMDDNEFSERAELYSRQKEQDGSSTIRIGKNMLNRTHACLIPWEKLDDLSAKESAITGKNIDYKAMDTDNVMAVPQLLRISKEL